ncbi:uncharacterized protein CLBA1 [Tiliqua scincoides]|uniref:uncharacterized protein CLBA1 n=1 Tax=Tiliqua scincoides TaxID=71010 RepID=UPI003462FA5F
MEDQSLAEAPWGAEISEGSFLRTRSAETCAVSHCESNEKADVCPLNQNGNLDESLEVETVQKTFPSEYEEGRIYEESPDSFLNTDMMESSGTWGDFEGFTEVKLENLNHAPESLESSSEKQFSTNHLDLSYNCFTTSCRQLFSRAAAHNRKEVFANVPEKASLSSEDVIKLSFPEVPVPQFVESISSLDQMLDIQTEEADIPEHMRKQLCTDSGTLWKILTCSSNPSGLRCPWNGSHYQANLLAVLGIDAHEKALPEGKDGILEKTNIKEKEDPSVDKFNISTCKALIQTKLSVSPDSRQNHLFTYNLFLKKTPSSGNMQYITIPQKKRIFTTQNLKMKMFSSNIC